MSLFADYLKLNSKEIIEDHKGFATFFRVNDGLYIEDIYVKEEFRRTGHAASMADYIANIAMSRGMNRLYGTVKPSYKHSTESMKVLLAYGFKIVSSTVDAIALMKEI